MSKTLRVLAQVVLFGGFVAVVPASAEGLSAPTFTKDIAPIFQEKCEACHRPDSIAPMSLVTFEEVRPWARSIKDARRSRVRCRRGTSRRRSAFSTSRTTDRSATSRSRRSSRWVDQGAPKGDPKDMPPPKVWPSEQGWNFAKLFDQTEPDLIIRSTPYQMKARANDAWWKPVVETGLTEARWVRAIEIRPGTVKGREDHASRDRALAAGRGSARPPERRSGRLLPQRRHVHGMGRRQAGRDHAAEHRQADAAGLADHLGHPLLRRRRRHHRRRRARASTSIRRARSRSTARRCT